MIDAIADHVSSCSERHDQLTVGRACRGPPTFRQIGQGSYCREQRIHGALRQYFAVWFEKLTQPNEIGCRAGQEDDLHGFGGGSSPELPQLFAQLSIAASGIASPVRSYSA